MLTGLKQLSPLLFAFTLAAAGCHAQVPLHLQGAANGQSSASSAGRQPASASGDRLPPDLARRVEVLIRSRASLPPDYDVLIGPRNPSSVPGYDEITVTFFSAGKTSKPMTFLLSKDNKSLAQFNKFDISKDPRTLVSGEGRPSRGGPSNAPVLIVGFDDLECPFCAKMHAQLFPALLDRYGNKVRIVYRDFPLDQHPWAMRAAIDTNCLAAQNPAGYWDLVDYIHAHAAEMGGEQKSLAKAHETLDTLTRDEGKRLKADSVALDACIAKQDDSAVKASIEEATQLGVDSTPALFINGEKLEGAVPLEYVYKMIDNALVASGQTPPPPPPPAAPVPSPQVPPAGKPGN
ncbi:DsbA family protein [Edaphobacter bradus]|uniref:DsbA family protein n=1 Tax=Edaphobacter bradus TaxID=2259016 RepID=UPI0021DFC34F|nr:DsbA family protein [Edaphobacter bradus]